MTDDFAAAKAGIDQLNAVIRDTMLPSVVDAERAILKLGGSPELALGFSLELGVRFCNMFRLGVITEDGL